MQNANLTVCTKLLKQHGQRGWVAIAQRYGKNFRLGNMVVTCDPPVVRALLMERPHAERRPIAHRLMGSLPGSNGILFMDGEPWLKRTRAVMPVFQQRNVDACVQIVHETTKAHLAHWSAAAGGADLYDAVQQLGAAALLKIGYGLDPGDPAAARLGRAMVAHKQFTMRPQPRYRFDELGIRPGKVFALPWILAGLVKLFFKTGEVRKALREVVAHSRPDGQRPDWITALSNAGLDEKALAEELNHLYQAFNAADYVATAALLELARDRQLAATIRRETVVVAGEAPPTRNDLERMPTTRAFILEVLRRYPVSMGVVRQTGTPLTIEGEEIPAGTQVMILLQALHHHPDFWDEPNVLRPERWLDGRAPKVPFSYVPFLDGSRKCIGRAMAEMHLLIVLTTILRRFDVIVEREATVPTFMIPRFAAPMPFRLEPAPLA